MNIEIAQFLRQILDKTPTNFLASTYLVDNRFNIRNQNVQNYVWVDRDRIQEMIEHIETPLDDALPNGITEDHLYSLSSCNHVILTISPTFSNISLHVTGCEFLGVPIRHDTPGEIINHSVKTITYPNRNVGQEFTTLPAVECMSYYCTCRFSCSCPSLRLPDVFEGERLRISRNTGPVFTIRSKQDYLDYVSFRPKFTFDPSMIIAKPNGLDIDYERYYAEVFGTEYCDMRFRITQHGMIYVSNTGIPLIKSVVDDLNFLKVYIYQFSCHVTLEADEKHIRQILPAGARLVLEKAPADK